MERAATSGSVLRKRPNVPLQGREGDDREIGAALVGGGRRNPPPYDPFRFEYYFNPTRGVQRYAHLKRQSLRSGP